MQNTGNKLLDFISECNHNLIYDKDDEVQEAIEYLESRGLETKDIEEHCIGYCYKEKDIPDYIRYYGNEDMDRDRSSYIKGRFILPINAEFGETIAFATRKPSREKGNMWWNLSHPFKKNNHLFLLDKSREEIFKNNKIYIVEGYMDALIMYKRGIKNVCALMGVNLSARKIGLIARYCDSICLCLDSDEAGNKAKRICAATLHSIGMSKAISVIDDVPEGEDPDSYILEHGKEEFLQLEKKIGAKEIKEYIAQIEEEKNDRKRK